MLGMHLPHAERVVVILIRYVSGQYNVCSSVLFVAVAHSRVTVVDTGGQRQAVAV